MDTVTSNALANEARRQQAKLAVSDLKARVDHAASLIGIINSTMSDANMSLGGKTARNYRPSKSGAGPGVTTTGVPRRVRDGFHHKGPGGGTHYHETLASFQALN